MELFKGSMERFGGFDRAFVTKGAVTDFRVPLALTPSNNGSNSGTCEEVFVAKTSTPLMAPCG